MDARPRSDRASQMPGMTSKGMPIMYDEIRHTFEATGIEV
jgi:hypothetical protein